MKKVNLHILEHCNFHCAGCFAHFDSKKAKDYDFWKQVLDNLKYSGLVDAINFAGGEPLIHKHFSKLVEYAKQLNFKVSVVTNGYFINEKWLDNNAQNLDCIGIYMDSLNDKITIQLGRCTNKNEIFNLQKLQKVCEYIYAKNLDTKIKLNTVVSRLNYNEKFTDKIKNLDISRWKIMKLKVFDNGKFNNRDLSINNEQFNYFLENNPHKNAVAESSMVNSYLMVDANGNLVDNASDNYKTIGNVYAEKFETLYKKYNTFNHNLYAERY